jgi:hypothetical protein
MSRLRENNHSSRYDFGFEEIIATASFDRFPAWYADRCLLANRSKKPLRVVETPPAIEALTKEAA